ncbi:hypothetical protein [Paraclostridium sordellii]|uniref:hypothetical protein n=1 Tax=Paraclostridium sordellii TaxID=1505 RepID=UPI0022E64A4B|nr:hypothetical protein [Paeniclostridium sordellii]
MLWEAPKSYFHPTSYETLELVAKHKQITLSMLHSLDKDISLDFHLQKLEEAGKIKIEGELVTFLKYE